MIYLPPYSPDLNSIENKWYKLKKRLKTYYQDLDFMNNLIREIRTKSNEL